MLNDICISIVSHQQGEMVNGLLSDIKRHVPEVQVIVTCNVPEKTLPESHGLAHFSCFHNDSIKGFGGNHNVAFKHCERSYFCVANPDIRLEDDVFKPLLQSLQNARVGLVAPRVVNSENKTEDNARQFPTPFGLFRKLLGGGDGRIVAQENKPLPVDWIAGMFMLFKAEAFRDVGGFDEKFFLYYEDVDICARLWKSGWKVMLDPRSSIMHAAQRRSHRDVTYMKWHLSGMKRYFIKHYGRLPEVARD